MSCALLGVDHTLTLRQKLSKLAAPDPFQSSSSSIKEGTRKVGENKLLGKPGSSRAGSRFQPYKSSCKDCKQPTTQNKAKYCHGCAFKKGKSFRSVRSSPHFMELHCLGLCTICGKQVLDTTGYSMSAK